MADAEGGGVPNMTIKDAVKEVLKQAHIQGNLHRGLRETVKGLDKRGVLLCVLAKNCNEALYVKLIEGLCNEHQVPLIKVEDKEELGEWAGLCKIDKDGKPRKIVKCSVVAVLGLTESGAAWDVIQDYLKMKAATAD